jgi:hypothetical protein
VTVLTDEISYVRRTAGGYIAFGTPFAGELRELGEPASAPVAALFRLRHAAETRHERLESADAVRTLMRNILFFAHDRRLVGNILDTACDFASRVPSYALHFPPDRRVWNTLG